MTRVQKWESYRQEIEQSSKIGQALVLQTQKIDRYKKEINKINPAILQNVSNVNLNLHKGVSEVVVSQKQVPVQISKMFEDLNKAKTKKNTNNISTILFNLEQGSILDKNKGLKEEWLKKDVDYVVLEEYIKQANLSLVDDKQLEKDLYTKFENLTSKRTQTVVGEINPLIKNNTKNIGHHVFVISIAIAIVFWVITLSLLLVGWFA